MSTTGSNPSSIAVVTGGKSGIGLAIATKIAAFPFIQKVLCVSRSITANDLAGNAKLVPLAADISTTDGRDEIVSTVQQLCTTKKVQLRYLIHSAGIIDPIKSVFDLTPQDLRQTMLINCEAPFFLTTALYPFFCSSGGRVLHVSSGAAHGAPPVGWACYGISKAAFFQSYKVLEREFRETHDGKHVVVSSFKPGVVDTAIQGTIRTSSAKDMPIVQVFANMKEKADAVAGSITTSAAARPPPKGALDTPDNVAHFVEFLLLGTSDEEFANKDDDSNEWDIRNVELYKRWISPSNLEHVV